MVVIFGNFLSIIVPQRKEMTVFSGTTIDNFLTCSESINGRVLFDKNKQKHMNQDTLFAGYTTDEAEYWARSCAMMTQNTPLIIGFKVPSSAVLGHYIKIPSEEIIKVDCIYIPLGDWMINYSPSVEKDYMKIEL